MLILHALSKRFGAKTVLAGVSVRFAAGVHVISGANGVGKSTLLALCAGIDPPDTGQVTVAGYDLWREPIAARRSLAYVPSAEVFYPFLRLREAMAFLAEARGFTASELDAQVDGFGLKPSLDHRLDQVSHGTQRKYLLAAALCGDAPVLILDEPSVALDAAALAYLAAAIRRRNGTTLVATHDLHFVSMVEAHHHRLHDARLESNAPVQFV